MKCILQQSKTQCQALHDNKKPWLSKPFACNNSRPSHESSHRCPTGNRESRAWQLFPPAEVAVHLPPSRRPFPMPSAERFSLSCPAGTFKVDYADLDFQAQNHRFSAGRRAPAGLFVLSLKGDTPSVFCAWGSECILDKGLCPPGSESVRKT